jgi:uncharacterized protein YegJ (DUF2314 family)
LLACGAPADRIIERPGEPIAREFEASDPEMAAAIAAARASVGSLIERLRSLRAEGADVSVKVPLQIKDRVEHLWLHDLDFRDGAFHGNIANLPVGDGGWSLGDAVAAKPEEISDWMVVRDGTLYGGFTIVVVRRRLSEEQRREFDASVDFVTPSSARTFE